MLACLHPCQAGYDALCLGSAAACCRPSEFRIQGEEGCQSWGWLADIFERFAALEKSGARAEDGAGPERRAGDNLPAREGQRRQDNEDGKFLSLPCSRKRLEVAGWHSL